MQGEKEVLPALLSDYCLPPYRVPTAGLEPRSTAGSPLAMKIPLHQAWGLPLNIVDGPAFGSSSEVPVYDLLAVS